MAAFYSNENFPLAVVRHLRSLGHFVLTTQETDSANKRVPDDEVLRYATGRGLCVLTLNRKDFKDLHRQGHRHAGIVVCTTDYDFLRLAKHIDEKVSNQPLEGQLIRVRKGGD